MLEKIIIFLIIIAAAGLIITRIRSTMKGNACSGCAKDCQSCHTTIPMVIHEEEK